MLSSFFFKKWDVIFTCISQQFFFPQIFPPVYSFASYGLPAPPWKPYQLHLLRNIVFRRYIKLSEFRVDLALFFFFFFVPDSVSLLWILSIPSLVFTPLYFIDVLLCVWKMQDRHFRRDFRYCGQGFSWWEEPLIAWDPLVSRCTGVSNTTEIQHLCLHSQVIWVKECILS